VVVTGASSGIGLLTARMIAAAGGRAVLVARNADALRDIVTGIEAEGGKATHAANAPIQRQTLVHQPVEIHRLMSAVETADANMDDRSADQVAVISRRRKRHIGERCAR
jgi:NADP-dependent 3-hydroxy acid dehydrogenase YdfG